MSSLQSWKTSTCQVKKKTTSHVYKAEQQPPPKSTKMENVYMPKHPKYFPDKRNNMEYYRQDRVYFNLFYPLI